VLRGRTFVTGGGWGGTWQDWHGDSGCGASTPPRRGAGYAEAQVFGPQQDSRPVQQQPAAKSVAAQENPMSRFMACLSFFRLTVS
jgi:hypothetical protein